MQDLGDIFGGLLCSVFFLALLGAIAAALVYLVRRTQEEEAAAKAELVQIVNSLPSDRQTTFFIQYNAQRKNPTTAVVLGVHGTIGIEHKVAASVSKWRL